ncbi:MAG: DUF1150 family protein [Devosia sp.]
MQANREHTADNSLRNLTPAQFMALGGNAVVYIKQVKGSEMGPILPGADFDENSEFHIVVSADGQPLMVGDSEDAVSDWLSDKSFGVAMLH